MRRRAGYFFCLIFCAALFSSQVSADRMMFDKKSHDFGAIKEINGKVSHTFVFENRSDSPLVLFKVAGNCKCLSAVFTKAPVKPGERGEITVTLDPDYMNGDFFKAVSVTSSAGQAPVRLTVQGRVIPKNRKIEDEYPYNLGSGLYCAREVLDFGKMRPGEIKEIELRYATSVDEVVTLDFVVEGVKGLEFHNPGEIPPQMRGVVRFSYTMPAKASSATFEMYPYLNGVKLSRPVKINIQAQPAKP